VSSLDGDGDGDSGGETEVSCATSFFLIEVGLGEKFDSMFAAIRRRGLHRRGIIKLETTSPYKISRPTNPRSKPSSA
jgi:hypothetical protein